MFTGCAALAYADMWHAGQMYGNMSYYVGHIVPVVALVQSSGFTSELEVSAAALHDVVEDTDRTIEDIRTLFGERVAATVGLLTHLPDEAYGSYLERVLTDYTASVIKACDSMVNLYTTVREFDRSPKMIPRIKRYSNVIDRVNQTYGFTF